jgi:predicted nucleic acid-binding protein
MGLVLDASSVLAWLVRRQDPIEAAIADALFSEVEQESAMVPPLWYMEVINGLLVAERRKLIPVSEASRFLSELRALPIAEDKVWPSNLQNSVLQLARAYSLTSYDAVYIDLCLRMQYSIATFDRKLATAARSAGIRIFGDPA